MEITRKLSLMLAFFTPLFMQAQFSLDTVQVSTLQAPMSIAETGRNITVLTAEQINALPSTSLDEILATVSGVEIQSRGGFGVQGDILMRGSTFSQVLIMVDGMKINDPLTGHFNSYIPVSPAEIERIEILRGAAAAMYGPDAVGGVINVITKTFSKGKQGTQLSGALNYGDHKLVTGNQGFSVKKGAASFGGGFMINQSAGEHFPEAVIDTNTTLSAYNNFFDIKTVGASFAYQFHNGFHIRARSSYDYRDFGARYFYTTSTFDKSTETVANWWNHLQFSKIGQSRSTDFNVAYKYNTDQFVFSPDFPSTNNHVSQLLNLTLNHLEYINSRFMLKSGLQVDYRQIESNDRGDYSDLHYGAYIMGVYQQDKLNLTTSLRGDYDDNYGFEFSPQLNVSFVLPSLVIRASAGRNFRAADYTERYVSNQLQNLTPGRSLGNPDLVAENGWSEEIGLDYGITKHWQIKTTFFARQSDNLIDFVSTPQSEIGSVSDKGSLQDDANYFFAKNVSNVNTVGFEAESNLSFPIKSKQQLNWNVGYTLLNTTNEADVISVYISSHAKHLVTNRLVWKAQRFDIGITTLFKQRNALIASNINSELAKSYMVWNARLGINLTSQFGLNFQVQNIFDEQYQNVLGANMPGRWLMGGVKWAM